MFFAWLFILSPCVRAQVANTLVVKGLSSATTYGITVVPCNEKETVFGTPVVRAYTHSHAKKKRTHIHAVHPLTHTDTPRLVALGLVWHLQDLRQRRLQHRPYRHQHRPLQLHGHCGHRYGHRPHLLLRRAEGRHHQHRLALLLLCCSIAASSQQ